MLLLGFFTPRHATVRSALPFNGDLYRHKQEWIRHRARPRPTESPVAIAARKLGGNHVSQTHRPGSVCLEQARLTKFDKADLQVCLCRHVSVV